MNYIVEVLLVSWSIIMIALLSIVLFSSLSSIDIDRRELIATINRIYITLLKINSANINSTFTISVTIPMDHRIIFNRDSDGNKLIVRGPRVDLRLKESIESMLNKINPTHRLVDNVKLEYNNDLGNSIIITFTNKLKDFLEEKVEVTYRSSAIKMTLVNTAKTSILIEVYEV